MELSSYFKILQGRMRLILLTLVVTMSVFAAGKIVLPPTYTATTKLRVVPFSVNSPDYGTYVYFDRLANTYSEIIKSSSIQDETKRRLGLTELPSYRIETIPQTELMRLSVTAADPQLAIRACDTLAAILIEKNQTFYKSDSGVQSILRDRLNQLTLELNKSIAERATALEAVPRDAERIAALERSIEEQQQTYSLTLTSYNQALVSQSTMANALTVIEVARLPDEALGSGLVVEGLLAGVVGVFGGVALAFAQEATNSKFYSRKQLEAATHAPVIGAIPRSGNKIQPDEADDDTLAGEAFRRLRANLNGDNGNAAGKTLLVTSASSGEGKSTISTNLAISMARAGRHVVLVDCDMHLPRLHELMKLTNDKGLTDVLAKGEDYQKVIQHTAIPMLDVLTAGPYVSNPTDLLGSARWCELEQKLQQDYPVIILDGPPILAVTDTLVLAPKAGGILLVVDQRKSNQQTVTAAREQLGKVGKSPIGVIFNRAPADASFNEYKSYASRVHKHK